MKVVVIHSAPLNAVLRRTFSTREWEGYHDNAAAISAALKRLGHSVSVIPDGIALVQQLSCLQPDIAWVCSGGIQGRDQACHLPAILETLGLRYVGSPPLAAGIADNKIVSKIIVSAAGILTPRHVIARRNMPIALDRLTFPVVVKPQTGMCSCAVTKALGESDLASSVGGIHATYHSDALIESYVEGRDISVSLLEQQSKPHVLAPLQRQFRWDVQETDPGWNPPHPKSKMLEGQPSIPELPPTAQKQLCEAARTVFRVLSLRHFARVDFRLDEDECYFLEANHKPDLTPDGLFAHSARLSGYEYIALIESILQSALD